MTTDIERVARYLAQGRELKTDPPRAEVDLAARLIGQLLAQRRLLENALHRLLAAHHREGHDCIFCRDARVAFAEVQRLKKP